MPTQRKNINHLMIWTGVVALLVVVGLAWWLLPVKEWVQSFTASIRGLGAAGILIFGVAYIVAVIFLAPAEIMTIAAGLIFGAWGFPLVVLSATIGGDACVSRFSSRRPRQGEGFHRETALVSGRRQLVGR